MNSEIKQAQDVLAELQERRKKRLAKQSGMNFNKHNSKKNTILRYPFRSGVWSGLCALGALSVCGCGVFYACDEMEKQSISLEQEHIHCLIDQIDEDIVEAIRDEYDSELLMLVNDYQSGKKLNGFKMAPHSAVFAAHSDLMSKYDAYNPDVRDKSRTIEDWILLDHMNYRYYQFREMNVSNKRGEIKNPYLDMLRFEFVRPAKRIPVRHTDFFEGLKLDNVMKR